jgi:hypothetical protein
MKTIIRVYFITLSLLLVLGANTNAQKAIDSLPDYSKEALWIGMIDNPRTNYYEAIKAYDTYFKYHKKPKDEDDSRAGAKENSKDGDEDDDDYLKSLSVEELNNYAQMKYQVKRFENWIREMKPFVQEDGRLLTDEERIAIWNKQQEELKQQHK